MAAYWCLAYIYIISRKQFKWVKSSEKEKKEKTAVKGKVAYDKQFFLLLRSIQEGFYCRHIQIIHLVVIG